MRIYSHRGHHEGLLENTHEAFEHACRLGVDGIETDVRRTSDGEAVLYHDRRVPRGPDVERLTLRQLCDEVGYTVPTLESALERWSDVRWMLEIKTPNAVEVATPIIDRYKSSRTMVVTSFWHNVIEQIQSRVDVSCGLLVSHRPRAVHAIAQLSDASSRLDGIVWHYEVLDPEIITAARSLGIPSIAYDVETPTEFRRCSDLGLSAVITDYPELVIRAPACVD